MPGAPPVVRCPWCEYEGPPRGLHAHLGEAHPEGVAFEERRGSTYYAIRCPICAASYEKAIKPRTSDPSFMGEYEREIRLVAFDMLVNHLLAEHAPCPGETGSEAFERDAGQGAS